MGFALAAVCWLPVSVLIMAFIEYVAHRWPMHNRLFVKRHPTFYESFEAHALLHHGRFYEDFEKDPDPAARYVNIDLDPGYELVGLSPLWGTLFYFMPPLGLSLALVILLHGTVWTACHREMHNPKGRWFSRTWYFRYIRNHHHTHHIHPGSNFGAVFPPLMDKLFGTWRPGTPAQERNGAN